MITWKPIIGYEGLYEVSSDGEVKSIVHSTGRRIGVLKMEIKNGYLSVNLYDVNGKCKHKYVHRLIAETFIPNPNAYTEVNHIDCNKHNNSVKNLEWCTRKQNLQHSYDNGLKRTGEKHGMHKLTEDQVREIRNTYIKGDLSCGAHNLARIYNVNKSTIMKIVTNRLWKEVV